jgi:hypothetical protein
MGAAVSGHSSHPEHSARFKRVVGGNRSPSSSRCRMCQLNVDVAAQPLRPTTAARNPAAPSSSTSPATGDPRRATSRTRSTASSSAATTPPAPASPAASAPRSSARRPSPTAAPKAGAPPAASGFHAHPRCCSLPQYMTAPPELKREHGNATSPCARRRRVGRATVAATAATHRAGPDDVRNGMPGHPDSAVPRRHGASQLSKVTGTSK